MSSAGRRICFISSRSGFIDESGTLYMDWANGRVIQQLAKRIPNLNVAIFAEPSRKRQHDFVVSVQSVFGLPVPFTLSGGIKNSRKIHVVLKRMEQQHDVLIIQLPFIGFMVLPFLKKPVVYHLCANVITAARNPFKYAGFKLVGSTIFAHAIHRVFLSLFKKNQNRLIVNGEELGNLYKKFNPYVRVSSSVYESEIISDSQVSQRKASVPFRLLFIGRPSKEKGFPTLLDAFQRLVDSQQNVTLTLVGVTKDELLSIINVPISDVYLSRIQFHGFIPWGEHFKQIVESSHCLLMCSVSEGTPRVVVEAMALGCPVIATRVGGISSTIQHEVTGLLFEPGEVTGLMNLILSLQTDEVFRQRIIQQALVRVREFTLEKFTETFVHALNSIDRQ